MKTNKDNLDELITPHTLYWNCNNDEPIKYNHTGKVVKIASEFAVSFSLFCAKNYIHLKDNKWMPYFKDEVEERTTEQLMTIYLKQKSK